MKKREAAIVSAYTGILLGSSEEMHKYIEEIMGRPVFTHELGDKATVEKIKKKSRQDFLSLTTDNTTLQVVREETLKACSGRDKAIARFQSETSRLEGKLARLKEENKELVLEMAPMKSSLSSLTAERSHWAKKMKRLENKQ